jgi:siroheme synthase
MRDSSRRRAGSATIVVLMGLAERRGIRTCLADAGWSPETPAAIVRSASQPDQRVWFGTLNSLDAGDGPQARRPDPGSS